MGSVVLCWTLLFTIAVCCGAQVTRDTSEVAARCSTDCSSEKSRAVCGSDGLTYNSLCELERQVCDGKSVTLRHRGKCQEASRCWKDQASAQSMDMVTLPTQQSQDPLVKGTTVSNFVPACNDDGTFAEVQCHPGTGYCWCATTSGLPIRGTSVRHRRPTCKRDRPGNGGNRRRNSRRRTEKQGCGHKDRSLFNKNLVKIFVSEYNRVSPPTRTGGSGRSSAPGTSDAINDSLEMRAVRWKFSEQDHNGNDYLDKRELKSLRRMVKKFVRPRECAKKFARFCDEDHNKKINRREWNICLGVAMNNEQTEASTKEVHVTTNEGTQRKKQITLTPDVKMGLTPTEEEMLDCLTERQNALDQQRMSQDVIYVPECTSDGKYTQVQCYMSTGYCWCVDQDGGMPIPSTSVRNVRPDCDKLMKADRPIKGCPEKKKAKFLVDFVDFLTSEMMNHSSAADHAANATTSAEDRLAQWKFGNLDTNQNKVLDRQEWRNFRRELKKRKSIRKCGRNFVKFCDSNNDRKIVFDEWMDCFSVLQERKFTSGPRRKHKGQNPLDKYLKND